MDTREFISIQTAGATAQGIIRPATVEVKVSSGLGIYIVGLHDTYSKEILLRVLTALQYLGFTIPGKKIIINITPGLAFRCGDYYDLPIAIGLLLASEQISVDSELLKRCLFFGELGLDGSIRDGEDYNGSAIASMMKWHMLGEKPLCLVTNKRTAISASPVREVLSYQFSDLATLLRVLQRAIVGTSHLIWFSKEWKEWREGIDDWATEVRNTTFHPL